MSGDDTQKDSNNGYSDTQKADGASISKENEDRLKEIASKLFGGDKQRS